MKSINRVNLLGNIGKDVEVKQLQSGSKYARTSLATEESYKDNSGEWQNSTTWHNLIFWNKIGERAIAEISKGKKIWLEGKISNRSWETDGGEKKSMTEIVVWDFHLVETNKKKDEQPQPQPEPAMSKSGGESTDSNESELPF